MNSFLTVVAMSLFMIWLYRTTVQTSHARAFNRMKTSRVRTTDVERRMSKEEFMKWEQNNSVPVNKEFLLKEEKFKEGEHYVTQEMNA